MTYKTAHEIARELLAGPDSIMVIALPVFDMPGCSHALPVRMSAQTIEERECIVITADSSQNAKVQELSGGK